MAEGVENLEAISSNLRQAQKVWSTRV